jgi:hsp70-interacting protein
VCAIDDAGWALLRAALSDSHIVVRRKLAFLLNTLILPNDSDAGSSSQQGGGSAAPVHANSHAAMLAEPGSAVTAAATVDALRTHGILSAAVHELVRPTPHGVDGETEVDVDLEEKLVRCVARRHL